MRYFTSFLFVLSLLFVSCEGDPGPPGPQGPPGQDGDIFAAESFETPFIDFNQNNDFSALLEIDPPFPQDYAVFVYRLAIDQMVTNGPDIWQLLPQPIIFGDGSDLFYNYDHSQFDVFIFLESSSSLIGLDPIFTEGQIFRIVAIPTIDVGSVDVSNLNSVMQTYGIEAFSRM
ncbi:MAG: collagen-like protein [Bacteroidota bacterium]